MTRNILELDFARDTLCIASLSLQVILIPAFGIFLRIALCPVGASYRIVIQIAI